MPVRSMFVQCQAQNVAFHFQDTTLKLPQIVAVAFSPNSTYLQTFQRPQKDAGNADKNLKVAIVLKIVTLIDPGMHTKRAFRAAHFESAPA